MRVGAQTRIDRHPRFVGRGGTNANWHKLELTATRGSLDGYLATQAGERAWDYGAVVRDQRTWTEWGAGPQPTPSGSVPFDVEASMREGKWKVSRGRGIFLMFLYCSSSTRAY